MDTANAGQSLLIPWEQLEPNPWNRKVDLQDSDELVGSVRRVGVRENLTVRPHPEGPKEGKERYEIASGERRWQAAQKAGNCPLLPCDVKNLTDEEVAEMNITANVQRKDIPPLELARIVNAYIEQFHKTQDQAAEKFGKTRTWATELLGFLKLEPEVGGYVGAPTLGWDQLRALKASSKEVQIQVAKGLKEGTIKPDQVEKTCNQLRFGPGKPPSKKGSDDSPAKAPVPGTQEP